MMKLRIGLRGLWLMLRNIVLDAHFLSNYITMLVNIVKRVSAEIRVKV
jgi:hypothetical protein